jgi:hypothetical protein
MEEANSEEKLLELGSLLAARESVFSLLGKGSLEVGLDSSGRLRGQLHAILQDRLGEEVSWHGSKEQSEVLMQVFQVGHVQHRHFKMGHELLRQVTILEEHPISYLGRGVDQLQSFACLTLTKRDGSNLLREASSIGELEKLVGRIGSHLQNEDQWSQIVCIGINVLHGHRDTLDIELTQVSLHIVLESKHQLLASENLEENRFLEVSDLLLPVSWQFSVLRI